MLSFASVLLSSKSFRHLSINSFILFKDGTGLIVIILAIKGNNSLLKSNSIVSILSVLSLNNMLKYFWNIFESSFRDHSLSFLLNSFIIFNNALMSMPSSVWFFPFNVSSISFLLDTSK